MNAKLDEGLIGCRDGGIYYANLTERIFTKLVGTLSSEDAVIKSKHLIDNIFATIHHSGGFKLWDMKNGEELAEFSVEDKLICNTTDVVYDANGNRIFAFLDNNRIKCCDFNDFKKSCEFTLAID